MTAIPHSLAHAHDDDHAHAHGHEEMGFLKKYIFSTDHKIIGIQFLFLGLLFIVLGGLLAMLIRWELAWPHDASHPVPILGAYMRASTRPPAASVAGPTAHAAGLLHDGHSPCTRRS